MSQHRHPSTTLLCHVRLMTLITLALLLTAACLWATPPAHASSPSPIIVNDFNDVKQNNDGKCTLREAIIAANSDSPSGYQSGECRAGHGKDVILLPPGVYNLSPFMSEDDEAAWIGDLDIRETVTISPTGPGLVVIDADASISRIFHVHDDEGSFFIAHDDKVKATIIGVTLRGGHAERGGAVLVEDGAVLHLKNSTLTGNSASEDGGAIYNAGSIKLINVTIAGNQAENAEAIYNEGGAQAEVGNTLIAANIDPAVPDCAGTLTSLGPNLVEEGAGCSLGDATLIAPPGFTPQQEGGKTVFYRLLAGSAAFNAGAANICPSTDQLGVVRPQFTQCDIGAHELDKLPPIAASLNVTTTENIPVTIGLSGSGSEGETLTFAIADQPGHGALEALTQTGDSTATVRYVPAAGYFGDDAFTYTVAGEGGVSTPATVTVQIAPDAFWDVTTTADSGPGSLRAAIESANAKPGPDTIRFAIAGSGVPVITLSSPLPALTGPVTIDGTTQTQGQVILDGGGGAFDGLILLTGAGGSTIRGLVIHNFGGSGVVLQQSGGNTLSGNIIRNNGLGSPGGDGIRIVGDGSDPAAAGGNIITGNTISGNGGNGITVIASIRNDLSGNDIRDNGGLPVDLGGDGRTPNDIGDTDEGANFAQNFPVLFRATPDNSAGLLTTSATATQISGWLNSQPNSTYTIRVTVGDGCASGAQRTLPTTPATVTTDGEGTVYFTLTVAEGLPLGQVVQATATDAEGNSSEYSDCIVVSADNDSWPRALPLDLSSGSAVVEQYLDLEGQARWYKFNIQPQSQVSVTLTGLPANYDLAIYKDLAAAYDALLTPQDLVRLSVEYAPSAFSPSAFSPSAFSPSAFSPSAFSPSAFSPSAFSPSAFSPSAFSPSAFSPSAFSPSAFSPSAFSPSAFSPSAFSPSAFSPSAFSPSAFSPSAFSSAQARSLIGVSAFDGTASEGLSLNTWNNTGDFYVRVRGREGAFSLDAPFRLEVTMAAGPCAALPDATTLPATGLSGQAGPYKTLVLVDNGRLRARYPAAEVDALLAQLATLAARAEVSGVVVDVGADPRVAAANARADQFAACPYAKNVVAESIKAVVNAYRAVNPLEYIVLVGNDDVIPFFRYPDNALLGHESNYVPPVLDDTSSQASLRLGYVLSQDAYGSAIDISLNATSLPVPDLAVGRLVETPAEIQTMLAAYLATAAGVAPTPQAALVTGYDFLEDVALAVRDELAAGLNGTVDSLITPNEVSPLDPASWTAQQLASQLGSRRYDIAFLAGHFNAASALAADYQTSFLTTDLLALPVDMTNMLVYSAGCHSGYNIVNPHGVPGVTFEPDWAQAFAAKGATLIAGTGYQYGDTEFIEYSERLYLEFTRQLRTGAGPVSVGKALVAAKQRYLATTPYLRGIHEKALLEATLFGLPMFAVDLPGQRRSPPSDAPEVGQLAPVAAGPGAQLGLRVADLSLTPQLTPRVLELKNVDDGSTVTASWLEGSDGVVTNPAEPALPLEILNVTAPGWVLRGVGFRGGVYQDINDILPLTGAPTTELRGVHSPFLSDVWFPIRPWNVNYFDALTGGQTRLFVTPAQHRSSSPGASTNVRRQFEQMDFRLFYSANVTGGSGATAAAGEDGLGALADAPSIVQVQGAIDGDAVEIRVRVVGNPAAGIQAVWITYTGLEGPWLGRWQSLDLAQNSVDSTLWEGRLPLAGTPARQVRFMAQAVNGLGVVALAENLGRYYTPGGDGPLQPTTLTLEPLAATSGAFGTTASFAAVLRDGAGNPLAGQPVIFGLGQQEQLALTDASGRAVATIPLLGLPGRYPVRAAFPSIVDYANSSTTSAALFEIRRQSSSLTLAPTTATGQPDEPGLLTATLLDGAGRRLVEQTVFFVITGSETYTRTVITNLVGEAPLGALQLPEGDYTVTAHFDGSGTHMASVSGPASLSLRAQVPTDDGPDHILYFPLVSRP